MTSMMLENPRSPLADIKETDEGIIVTLDVPGINEESIDITAKDNDLSVKAERQPEKAYTDEIFHMRERTYPYFVRSTKLPASVNAEEAKTTYENGVLVIHLPKLIKNAKNKVTIERKLQSDAKYHTISQMNVTQQNFQILSENNVEEYSEVIDVQEYPMDNSSGSYVLTLEQEISKTESNEISIADDLSISGRIGTDLMTLISAEISGKLSNKVGQICGETNTRPHTLRFKVKPHSSVKYIVIWTRKIRKVEFTILLNEESISIPYQMCYELSPEIKSQEYNYNSQLPMVK